MALPLPEKTRPALCQHGHTQILRNVEDAGGACLAAMTSNMSVWVAGGQDADGHEGPVERHGHVRRPAGGRGRRPAPGPCWPDGLFLAPLPSPDMGFALHVGPGPYGFRVLPARESSNSTSDSLSVLFHWQGAATARGRT